MDLREILKTFSTTADVSVLPKASQHSLLCANSTHEAAPNCTLFPPFC